MDTNCIRADELDRLGDEEDAATDAEFIRTLEEGEQREYDLLYELRQVLKATQGQRLTVTERRRLALAANVANAELSAREEAGLD